MAVNEWWFLWGFPNLSRQFAIRYHGVEYVYDRYARMRQGEQIRVLGFARLRDPRIV